MPATKSSIDPPLLRWGIIGSGTVAKWFIKDLLLPRKDAKIRHVVQAVGSTGASELAESVGLLPNTKIYGSHAEVYADPDVDVVHIAVPHGLHLPECLAAIQAGKHVLCEKPLAMNAKEVATILKAASEAGVWLGEGLWTRALPITSQLIKTLHENRDIGRVLRVVSDFGFRVDIASLPWTSRYKDPKLGAGSLLDMGVYSINWALIAAGIDIPEGEDDDEVDEIGNLPKILATQTLEDVGQGQHVDIATGALLQFDPDGLQAVLSCTSVSTRETGDFCRIDGTDGYITLSGLAPPLPTHFVVHKYKQNKDAPDHGKQEDDAGTKYECESPGGMGFYWEADEVGLDIMAGRTRSSMMPWSQTMLVTRIMDEIRKQGGAKFPQDQ